MHQVNLTQHRRYMDMCLKLAWQAVEQGNTGVGSLVVKADQVVGAAGEELPAGLDVTGHAEVLAIRRAAKALNTLDLSGCTLYTTAEPCWMCSYAIRESGISTVVIGAPTPDVGGISSQFPLLTAATIEGWGPAPQIISGVLLVECDAVRANRLSKDNPPAR